MRIVLATVIYLVVSSAFAEPPAGTDMAGPEHLWWECHQQPSNNVSCCSVADGHSLGDADWKAGKDGYKVRINGSWYDVPQKTILRSDSCGPDPNDRGMSDAKVWYTWMPDPASGYTVSIPDILCFMPGVFY